MNTEELDIYHNFTVLLQIRYITGMKYGYLQPRMTPEKFESWWRDQETVNIFFIFDTANLPGEVRYTSNQEEFHELIKVAEEEKHWRLIIQMDKDSFLWKPGGIYVYHKGKTESDDSRYEVKGRLNVLLQEEYGYRTWIWQPEMDAMQLEEWWQNLETVMPYFFNPGRLPGTMLLVKTEDQVEQYEEMSIEGIHYTGHIHQDNDSYLKSPDKRIIQHKGYGKEEIDPDTPIYL